MINADHVILAREKLQALHKRHGDHLPLHVGMALVACEEDPNTSEDAIEKATLSLSQNLYIPEEASVFEQAARLTHHMHQTLGFQGDKDDFHNPSNSLIHRSIATKKGLPITLSTLSIEIGRQVGISLQGIGFPGHFLIQIKGCDPPFYIDPYNNGKIHRPDELKQKLTEHFGQINEMDFQRAVRPNTPRQILMRVNNNLIRSYQMTNQPKGMLRAIERNLILNPKQTDAHRLRGAIMKSMGYYREAIDSYEQALAQEPDGPDAERMLQELSMMKGIG